MNKGELLGFFRWILPVPSIFRPKRLDAMMRRLRQELGFLTAGHREVLRLAVRSLIESEKPLETIEIASRLNMAIDRAEEIISDLEKRAGLITRNRDGAITGAYPVSLVKTPCRPSFPSGKRSMSKVRSTL
jgi:hypothetical protein